MSFSLEFFQIGQDSLIYLTARFQKIIIAIFFERLSPTLEIDKSFSQNTFSNAALDKMIDSMPHISESCERQLKQAFTADYRDKKSIFSDGSLFEKVEEKVEEIRLKDMAEAIEWVKKARTPKGYEWEEKNYAIVPSKVRLMATPDIGKKSDSFQWRCAHNYDRLNQLEMALHSLIGIGLPRHSIGERIVETWENEASNVGYSAVGIETFKFRTAFFEIKAFRSAPDQITFSPQGLDIINQKEYNFSKCWLPKGEPEIEEKDESTGPEKEALAEVIEFERKWLERRAELRESNRSGNGAGEATKEAIGKLLNSLEDRLDNLAKEEKLALAKRIQNKAINKHPKLTQRAHKKIVIEFSERDGFMVFGATKEISQELGRKGLGLAYYGPKKIWYTRGSRGRCWSENYLRFIDGIKDICKARDIKIQTDLCRAEAA